MNTTPGWQPSLEDAWTKLDWAGKHFEVLRSEIEPFQQRDTHRIEVEIDANAGQYVFYVRDLDTPCPDWGLQIGDCLHNARTALDYLAVRLLALATGQRPRDVTTVQFPVYEDPARFGFDRKNVAATVTEFRKHPSLKGYLTRIEELQPFNLSNQSIWGTDPHGLPVMSALPAALQRLSALDNADKHRVMHATWLGNAGGPFAGPEPPPEFTKLTGSFPAGPLEDDAEIGRLFFATPLPFDWRPTEMEMKRKFPIHVTLDEPLPFGGVLEILSFCLWGVGAVLTLFEPVFRHGAPPLPVTTVGEPPPRMTSFVVPP